MTYLTRIYAIISILFLIVSCTDSKNSSLEQAQLCLEAKHYVNLIFNVRNNELEVLAKEAREDLFSVDRKRFKLINKQTDSIDLYIKHYSFLLQNGKDSYSNTDFIDATEIYLSKIIELEEVALPFLKSIEDSIPDNESELATRIGKLARGLKSHEKSWNVAELKFYQKNNIYSNEVDSIVSIIKKQKPKIFR